MPDLVTLEQFKQHLKLPLAALHADDELQTKLTHAEALVLDWVTQRVSDSAAWAATVAAWTEDTAPPQVIAAILVMAGYLTRYRGEEDRPDRLEQGRLPADVEMYLYRLRDPALA